GKAADFGDQGPLRFGSRTYRFLTAQAGRFGWNHPWHSCCATRLLAPSVGEALPSGAGHSTTRGETMPTVTKQYRMFVPRRRRISPGAVVDIVSPTNNLVTGDYSVTLLSQTIEVHYPGPHDSRAAFF